MPAIEDKRACRNDANQEKFSWGASDLQRFTANGFRMNGL
jgi:hypothetical protein